MKQRTFRAIATIGILGMFATGFLDPKYSLVSLLPFAIIVSCAYAIFKYEDTTENTRALLLGILAVFIATEVLRYERVNDQRRLSESLAVDCKNAGYPMDGQQFADSCAYAQDAEFTSREPTFGRLW